MVGGWTCWENLSRKHTQAVFLVIDFPTRFTETGPWGGWCQMDLCSSPNWNVVSCFSRNYPTPKLHQIYIDIYIKIFWSRMIKKIVGISSYSHEEISETVLWDLNQVQTNTLSAFFLLGRLIPRRDWKICVGIVWKIFPYNVFGANNEYWWILPGSGTTTEKK